MNIKFLAVAVLSLAAISTSYAAEWYEGGTLVSKTAIEWQSSLPSNRLATAADIVAKLSTFSDSALNGKINSMDDLKPYAMQLTSCLDESFKLQTDPEQNRIIYANQTVAGIAAVCSMLLW